jgi:hypothetical protein
MCEQCSAKTVYYVHEDTNNVLPGYILVRATQDGWEMKKDDWGLVKSNDPDFIWSTTPVCDPDDGLTDEQIETLQNDQSGRYVEYEKALNNLKWSLNRGCFNYCVRLGDAMQKAGWNHDNNDGAYWLCNHIAKFLKTATIVNEIGNTK